MARWARGVWMVSLERVSMRHAEVIQELVSDPAVLATTRLPSPYPPSGTRIWVHAARQRVDMGRELACVVVDDCGTVVGVCSLAWTFPDAPTAELGYWIGRPYWNRGVATEAARRILELGFEANALEAVRACSLSRNAASCRVLEKLGFRARGGSAAPMMRWRVRERLRQFELTYDRWRLSRSPRGAAPGNRAC